MRTYFYVDGFNLYYSALRGTRYRWLNLDALFRHILASAEITHIRYFTAKVKSTPQDPNKPQRQDLFLRALLTLPNLTVHLGEFRSDTVRMPLAHPAHGGPKTVDVIRTTEKGSDVNLASYLLFDAFKGEFEQAVVVTNDSDLVLPIRLVRRELRLNVGVLSPQRDKRRISHQLVREANFYRTIREGPLSASQFRDELHDASGIFRKPGGW